MQHTLETDYLIIGAGAMGMAFADELIHRSPDLRVIIVERRAKTGGHWNDAYSFVQLHQPAAFYGVNSEVLGTGGEDLASKAEILAYYERVANKLVATGRVQVYLQCDYTGDGAFHSLLDPDLSYQVTVRCKTVDATYSQMKVPSTHPPSYTVADGVALVPINGLATLKRPWSRYVVIGAGKTGMDAVLHLLDQGVAPKRIQWVMPNDSWYFNRRYLKPQNAIRSIPRQAKLCVQLQTPEDFFLAFEAEGLFMRFDETRWPSKFRCATVSPEELEALRTVEDIVRLGRVQSITPQVITLEEGTLPTHADVLHIDCSADGLVKRPAVPVFGQHELTLQPFVMCQQVFSAAFTVEIELRYDDTAHKNHLSTPIPHPEYPADFFSCHLQTIENTKKWLRPFGGWMLSKRLSVIHHTSRLDVLWALVRAWRWFGPSEEQLRRLASIARGTADSEDNASV